MGKYMLQSRRLMLGEGETDEREEEMGVGGVGWEDSMGGVGVYSFIQTPTQHGPSHVLALNNVKFYLQNEGRQSKSK